LLRGFCCCRSAIGCCCHASSTISHRDGQIRARPATRGNDPRFPPSDPRCAGERACGATDPFTWHSVWLNHLNSQASTSAFTSINSSGPCKIRKSSGRFSHDVLLACNMPPGWRRTHQAKSLNLQSDFNLPSGQRVFFCSLYLSNPH
jgi:hypothetical protein